jgi:thiamine pyrophosphate-dependent acetolactate synthase large subunit-like protein
MCTLTTIYLLNIFSKAAPVPIPGPLSVPSSDHIRNAVELIKRAHKPFVIIGKGINQLIVEIISFIGLGAGWSVNGSIELTQFINATGLPFLATPGGKGVVSDLHAQSFAPARSL